MAEVDRKIFLPMSLEIDFFPYMILDQGFLREKDKFKKKKKKRSSRNR